MHLLLLQLTPFIPKLGLSADESKHKTSCSPELAAALVLSCKAAFLLLPKYK